MGKPWEVLVGDVRRVMREMPGESFDACLSDPPSPATCTDDNWPRGWWRNSAVYNCCGKARGHRIKIGEPIYLTGKSGEMFCERHAPAGAASQDGTRVPVSHVRAK